MSETCVDCGSDDSLAKCTVCRKTVCPTHRTGTGALSDGYQCIERGCFGEFAMSFNDRLLMDVQLAAAGARPPKRVGSNSLHHTPVEARSTFPAFLHDRWTMFIVTASVILMIIIAFLLGRGR